MLLILEGPDGAGKTTLANELAELGHPVAHLTQTRTVEVELEVLLHATVLDRSYLSEQVYGPLLRGRDSLGVPKRRMLDRAVLGRGGIVVLIVPSLPTLWPRLLERVEAGTNKIPPEKWREMCQRYAVLETSIPIISYHGQSAQELVVMAELYGYPNAGPGTGAWRPGISTLIIGDRTSSKLQHEQPFIRSRGSAPWLTEALELAGGLPEDELYWFNAYSHAGRGQPAAWVGRLKPKRILALGNAADGWCERHRLTRAKLPHPSFWKRFYGRHALDSYAEKLKRETT